MKKLFLLFALFGLLTFASCGGGTTEEATETEEQVEDASSEEEAPEEEAPAEEAEPMEGDSTEVTDDAEPMEGDSTEAPAEESEETPAEGEDE